MVPHWKVVHSLLQAKLAVMASSLPSSRKAHLQRALELAHGHVPHTHDNGHSLANLTELITLSAGGSLGTVPGREVPSLLSATLEERASCLHAVHIVLQTATKKFSE